MSCATIDVQTFPLVVVVFKDVTPTLESFRVDFLDSLQELLDNQRPFRLHVDTTRLKDVPMNVCVDIVRFMKKNRSLCKEYLEASAVIVSSVLILKLMDFVFTLSPPVSPNRLVRTAEEATDFLNSVE